MKIQMKSAVSVLLCFLLIFGQCTPFSFAGITAAEDSSASVTGDVYTDTGSDAVEKVNFAPESMVNPVISGEIRLPAYYTVPLDGVNVTIYASNGTCNRQTIVNIPGGGDRAPYSIDVDPGSGYVVYYKTSNPKYVNEMYCGYVGMVRSKSSAAVFDLSAGDMPVNITLMPMSVISGIITLPGNTSSTRYKIYAYSDKDERQTEVKLDSNEAAFSLLVPPNTPGSGYTLKYEAIDNKTVISPGFYSESGTQRYQDLANKLDVSTGDRTDLSIEIVKKKIIKGTLSLPEGATIPSSSVTVNVRASYGQDGDNKDVILTNEKPSSEYTLYVPEGTGYTVSYNLNNVVQFMQNGYYNRLDTVPTIDKAETIDVTGGDRTDVNIKLIAKSTVRGIVKLPDGLKAPAGGVEVTVAVSSSKTTVKIPEGEDYADYTVYVPEGRDYKLYYETKNENYVKNGYHNTAKTVMDANSATAFNLSSNENKNINIVLIAKNEISGTIQLPSGTVKDGDIKMKITAWSDLGSEGTTTAVIPNGQSSTTYSLTVPPGTSYKVRCEITENGITYIKNTYYSTSNTVYKDSFASEINATAGTQSNINFVLLEKRKISGTISMPMGRKFENDVIVSHKDNEDGRTYYTIIYAGQSSAEYTYYCNPGVHKSFLDVGENDTFVKVVYYSDTGTVMDESAATPIDVTTSDVTGKDLVLILKEKISGKVVLQKGTILQQDASVTVKVKGGRGEVEQKVTIQKGTDGEAAFSLTVPPGNDYKLWYENVSGSGTFVSPMYYNSGNMTKESNLAGLIDLSKGSKSDIILTLYENRFIKGSIGVPESYKGTLNGDLKLKVYIENTKTNYSTDVVIPKSGDSVPYCIYVPAGNDYIVRYNFPNENNDFVRDGYYGGGTTVQKKGSAKSFDLTKGNESEVNLTLIEKKEIKGTVSIPEGVSLASSLKVDLYAGSYTTSVTLQTDGKPVAYILKVPLNDDASTGYKVFYKIGSNIQFNDKGYYSPSGMTSVEEDARKIDLNVDKADNINLYLIPKSSISGVVKLPSGNLAARETKVTVLATNGGSTISQDIKIKEGTNFTPYTLYVPSGTGYRVYYDIGDNTYVKNGYYKSADLTVKDKDSAGLVNIGENGMSGIDLTIIGKAKITGTILLPKNKTAPAGGLNITITAKKGTENVASVSVKIWQSLKSAEYALYVPPQSDYKLFYQVNEISYISKGFYKSESTTVNEDQATLVNVISDVPGINFVLIPKKEISGTISLPPSSELQVDIPVQIYAVSGSNKGETEVKIPNTGSVGYTVYVPAEGDYEVRYQVDYKNMFISPGYYSKDVTTDIKDKATLVKVNGDTPNVNLMLIPKISISGTIFIKNESAPVKGLVVRVNVTNGKITAYKDFVIPEGSSFIPYTIYMPAGKDYVVSYTEVNDAKKKYLVPGYYKTANETTRNPEEAFKFDLTNGSAVGANLTIIRKREISGNVSLNATAPYGGLGVKIIAYNTKSPTDNTVKDSGEANVIIAEGVSSEPFTIYVPEGADYRLKYELVGNINTYPHMEKCINLAYYNIGGSVSEKDYATLIDVTYGDKSGANINIIPKYLIGGSIYLPKDVVVPTGGLQVDVTASNSKYSVTKTITILEKDRGAEYKLYVPQGSEYKVGYRVPKNNPDCISGYYSFGGTVQDVENAKTIDVDAQDKVSINMTILSKKIISGKISMNEKLSEPVKVKVYAGNESTVVDISKVTDDQSYASYTLKVVPQKNATKFKVRYELVSANEEYVTTAYYGQNGGLSGGMANTVYWDSYATDVDVAAEDKKNIDMVLLKKKLIRGKILLPNQNEAPKGGISVDVTVEGADVTKTFKIEENEKSAEYNLFVPPSKAGTKYKIKYVVKTLNTGYAATAYFNYSKPTQDSSAASEFSVTTDNNKFDLTLIGNFVIEGTLELPEEAPENGINVKIFAVSGSINESTEVFIPKGKKHVNYTLNVPPQSNYKVFYEIKNVKSYVEKAYYGGGGKTVLKERDAVYVNTQKADAPSTNLYPIMNNTISGKIKLPDGVNPSKPVQVKIIASNGDCTKDEIKSLTESIRSADFILYCTPGENYRVYYEVADNKEYFSNGYYNNTDKATLVKNNYFFNLSGDKDYSNINFEIISNNIISGTVSVDASVPAGGMDVDVKATNGTYSKEVKVRIPESKKSIEFSLPVPPASGYSLYYNVKGTGDYYPSAYYKADNSEAVLNKPDSKKLDLTTGGYIANLKLKKYNSISGKVILPEAAPSGGVKFAIYAKNNKNERKLDLIIPENKTEVEYTLYVPEGEKYKVYYSMPENENYAGVAYYGQLKTVLDEGSAMPIDIFTVNAPRKYLISIIPKKSISGTITLSEGNASSDILVKISAINYNTNITCYEKVVTIPAKSNSVPYEIKVVPNNPQLGDKKDKGYIVKFETVYNYGFIKSGYYIKDGYVRNVSKADILDVSSAEYNGIDFELKPLKEIKGEVRLEKGVAPTGGMEIKVIAENSVDTVPNSVTILAGSDRAEYTLYMPPNDDEKDSYIVRYENWGNQEYLSTGYYANSSTVRDEKDAKRIDVRGDTTQKVILTIEKKMCISGEIALPNDERAPEGGLKVTIGAKNFLDSGDTVAFIASGSVTAPYTLWVPAGSGYELYYEMPIINDYVTKGYYYADSKSMSYKPAMDANKLDLSFYNLTGCYLKLIKKKLITGVVKLPNNEEAKTDITVTVKAENAGNTVVKIKEKSNYANYTIKVAPNVDGKGYKLSYEISPVYGYVTSGYYNGKDMVRNSKNAVDIVANDFDAYDKDLTLVAPKKIKGKVMLPKGIIASDNGITINITGTNGVDSNTTTTTIPKGSNSAEYVLELPPNDDLNSKYTVKYENWNDLRYTLYGYYNVLGTTTVLSDSTGVDIGTSDAKDIDFTLIDQKTIKGNIIVPEGANIPEEGLSLIVVAENGLKVYETKVDISNEAGLCPYTIYVEPNTGYKVKYLLKTSNSFMEIGYFSENGTTIYSDKASDVKVLNSDAINKDISLLMKRKITGTVTLPDGVNNTEGKTVIISAVMGKVGYSEKVFIPSGENSEDFTLDVPSGKEYKILYEVASDSDIASIGYYNTDEESAVRNESEAEIFDLSTEGRNNVNIKLLLNRTIRGAIKLPKGTTPDDGLKVTVTATATDNSGTKATREFFIPAGQRSVPYILSVVPLPTYTLKYEVSLKDYEPLGYYKSTGWVMLHEQADTLDLSDKDAEGIDIILLEKKEICGTVSLPQGISADNDIILSINAVNTRTGDVDSQEVSILSNTTSVPYSIKLTSGLASDTYKVYYKIENGYGVLETGYYNTSLTVPDINLASPLNVSNGGINGADMEMIKSRTISGKISRDSGYTDKAPITLNVYAEKTGYTGYRAEKTVTIEKDKNDVEYELNVPEYTTPVALIKVEARTSGKNSSDTKIYSISTNTYVPLANGAKSSTYRVGYSYVSSDQVSNIYCQSGYYSNSQAGEVNVSGGNKSDINLEVKLKDIVIKGFLEIPDSAVIPKDGMIVNIKAFNEKLDYAPATSIRVLPGNKSVEYKLLVPEMKNYHIKYEIMNPAVLGNFMESGFYSSSGTVGKESKASYVDAPNASDKNLKLIPGIKLGGTIKLPVKVEYDNFGVWVNASNDYNQYSVFVPIAKGSASASYNVYVPAGKDYIISYTTQMLMGEYVRQFYYSYAAATTEVNNATKITVERERMDYNITLIPTERTITGAVSLPEGTGDTAFAINVPKNEIRGGYNVSYTVVFGSSPSNAFINGFYSKERTVKDIGDSDLLDVYEGNVSNIKMPLYKEGTILLNGMVMNKSFVSVLEGASVQLGVKFYSEDAANKVLTWSSSNTNVAKVSSDGKVTALSQGSAVITAVSSNMIAVQCQIGVTSAGATGFSLDKKEIYLIPNASEQLSAIFGSDMEVSDISWSSNKSSIATVTDSGEVNAKNPGVAVISAVSKSDSTVVATCTVNVINPEVKVSIEEPNEYIMAGKEKTLSVKVTADESIPENILTRGVIWSSSDPTVATVDENGKVSAKKKGTVVITARSSYNRAIADTCSVNVTPIKVTRVQYKSMSSNTLYDSIAIVMDTFSEETIKATALPTNAENGNVTFESSDTSIIRIITNPEYKSGFYEVKIMALAPTTGSNTVKVYAKSQEDNRIQATCYITVNKVPVSSFTRVSGEEQATTVGNELTLEVKVGPNNASNRENITWESSNSNYVSLEAISGTNMKCKVKAKAITSSPVTVTAKLEDGDVKKTVSFKISVAAAGTVIIFLPNGNTSLGTPLPTTTPTPTLKVTPTPTKTATPTATPKVAVKPDNTKPGANGISDYKDIKGHWAYNDFELLLGKGIIGGYPDKTLKPNAEITRAEISKIIVVAAGYQPSNNTNLTCADKNAVPDWAKPYVKTAMNVGIMSGFEDNTFRPGNKLTRKEMAVIIMKAFAYEVPSNGKLNFKDAGKIPPWAKDYVAKAVEMGIIKGYSDNTFKPDKTITRAEVAAMIARCIK